MLNLKITITNESGSSVKFMKSTLEKALNYVSEKNYPEDYKVNISERIFDTEGDLVEINKLN